MLRQRGRRGGSLSKGIKNSIKSSAPYNFLTNRKRMRELKDTIKKKGGLGYETAVYEKELIYLQNNKFSKNKFRVNE